MKLKTIFLICLTMLVGCSNPAQPITYTTYSGAWFDIEYPANFTVNPREKSTSGEGFDGVVFADYNDKHCYLYIYSPQWSGTSEFEMTFDTENLLSETVEGNTTKFIYEDTDKKLIRTIEIIEKSESIRYLFGQGHDIDGDPCQKEYDEFKKSLIQYAD